MSDSQVMGEPRSSAPACALPSVGTEPGRPSFADSVAGIARSLEGIDRCCLELLGAIRDLRRLSSVAGNMLEPRQFNPIAVPTGDLEDALELNLPRDVEGAIEDELERRIVAEIDAEMAAEEVAP